eukprot:1113007_1
MDLYYDHLVSGYIRQLHIQVHIRYCNDWRVYRTLCIAYYEDVSFVGSQSSTTYDIQHALRISNEEEKTHKLFQNMSMEPKQFWLHHYYFTNTDYDTEYNRREFETVIEFLHRNQNKKHEQINNHILRKIFRKFLKKNVVLSDSRMYRNACLLPPNEALTIPYVNHFMKNGAFKRRPLITIQNICTLHQLPSSSVGFSSFGVVKQRLPSIMMMQQLFEKQIVPFGFNEDDETQYFRWGAAFRLQIIKQMDALKCYKVFKIYQEYYQKQLCLFYQYFVGIVASKEICNVIFDYINNGSVVFCDLMEHRVIHEYLMDSTKLSANMLIRKMHNYDLRESMKWMEYYVADICSIKRAQNMESDPIVLWISILNEIPFNTYNGAVFMMVIQHIVDDIAALESNPTQQKQCGIVLCCNNTVQELCAHRNELFFSYDVFGYQFRDLLINCIFYHIL